MDWLTDTAVPLITEGRVRYVILLKQGGKWDPFSISKEKEIAWVLNKTTSHCYKRKIPSFLARNQNKIIVTNKFLVSIIC